MSDQTGTSEEFGAPRVARDHVSRAQLLMQQNRPADAETHLREALADDPDDANSHALLAFCLMDQGKSDAALAEAKLAQEADPDWSFTHYTRAMIHARRDEGKLGEPHARRCIEMDPHDSDHWHVLALTLIDQKRWKDALAAADQGLAQDPDDDYCRNTRAMMLTQLGRRDEAAQTIRGTLESDPDNAHTHANMGWSLLHQNKPKEALESFREALRLDPDNEWAKEGLVEALKARYVIYRVLLAYFLWMGRLSDKAQWAVIIGLVVGYQVFKNIARNNEALQPLLIPVAILYFGFCALTWLADPLFNLLLRFNKYGWHALSPDQRRGANLLGIVILVALAIITIAFVTRDAMWVLSGVILFGAMVPLTGIFRVKEGWPRWVIVTLCSVLAITAVVLVAILTFGEFETVLETIVFFALPYAVAVFVSWLFVGWLTMKHPAQR
ncbi:MAG: tetratricopeptide repeat protein [Planctomycetota bacterium]